MIFVIFEGPELRAHPFEVGPFGPFHSIQIDGGQISGIAESGAAPVPLAVLGAENNNGIESLYHIVEDAAADPASWYNGPAYERVILRGPILAAGETP